MTPLIPAVIGAALVGGALLAVLGLVPVPDDGRPGTARAAPRPIAALLGDSLPPSARRRRRLWLAGSALGGVLVGLLSGWARAVVVFPLLAVGFPLRPGGDPRRRAA